MHLKEFGFLYAGFLNHCQGTKRDCLWFFVLIQTMKVYQIISCQAKISQGKKNCESVFKPTAHVFIIFSVQKVLHVLHSWDCNNAKKIVKRSIVAWKFSKEIAVCSSLWCIVSFHVMWYFVHALAKCKTFTKRHFLFKDESRRLFSFLETLSIQ